MLHCRRCADDSHQCAALGSVTAKSEVCAEAAPRRVSVTNEVKVEPSIVMTIEPCVAATGRLLVMRVCKEQQRGANASAKPCDDDRDRHGGRQCASRRSLPTDRGPSARVKRFTAGNQGAGKKQTNSFHPHHNDTWLIGRTIHWLCLPTLPRTPHGVLHPWVAHPFIRLNALG